MYQLIEINNLVSQGLEVYTSLSENQLRTYYEPNGGLFIAESPKVIMRALDAGYEPLSFLMEKRHVEGEAEALLTRINQNSNTIPVYIAELDLLKQLTGFELTRGCLCAMKRRTLPDVKSICKNATRIAVLENVVNPTNVGAIIRSAAALGIDAILLTEGCSDALYRRAARVSMGTVFQIPWTFITENTLFPDSQNCPKPDSLWPDQGMQTLSLLGFKTAAMALSDNSISIDDPALLKEEKLAIILGTEGDGLSMHTIADCDYTVKIPMSHQVDSLNVAAASAVAFWQLGHR